MAHLSVVAVICKIHFRPDQKDFSIQADYSTVVPHISVLDGHFETSVFTTSKSRLCILTSNVQQNVIAGLIGQDLL